MNDEKVSKHWDKMASENKISAWLQNEYIHREIMKRITGSPSKFWLTWLIKEYVGKKLAQVLSIGCGPGDHEILLAETGLIKNIDAFDISRKSIDIARKKAQEKGIKNINFIIKSFDEFVIDHPKNHYDAVCFFGSLHHVKEIEEIIMAARESMKDDGYLLFNEFVGNCYSYIEKDRIEIINDIARLFDSTLRSSKELYGHAHPSRSDILNSSDPSEAIRSSLILPLLQIDFNFEILLPYGGHLLHMLYPLLNNTELNDGTPKSLTIIKLLCYIEDLTQALSQQFKPDFYVGVCRPRILNH